MANNYPLVFIHGMCGWGEGEYFNSFRPYYGMNAGSLVNELRSNGIKAFAPYVGPLSSAWDRACELYAILTGSTVDYGLEHAKKYGHSRFGRTYKTALIPDWGKLDENGKRVKIHLIGHSFGGATIRELVNLLDHGCKEEMDSTGKDTSPLFMGGKGDWVSSVTALASPHEGATLTHFMAVPVFFLKNFYYLLAGVLGNTPFNMFYDFYLEQFGITSIPDQELKPKNMLKIDRILKAANSHDNVFYDLRIDGADELNRTIQTSKDVYYFSVPTLGTEEDINDKQVPGKIMNKIFYPFARSMAKHNYTGYYMQYTNIDRSWMASDGLVPLGSAFCPIDEPNDCFDEDTDKSNLKKGMWYVYPPFESDHGTIIGGSRIYKGKEGKKKFIDTYMEHINLLFSL